MSDVKFKNGEWYRCKVGNNGRWEVSSAMKTTFFEVDLVVVGGEMESEVLPKQIFVKDNTKDQAIAAFAVLDFDATKEDLNKLRGPDSPIFGKEVWAKCDIQAKERGGGFWPPRAGDICKLNDRILGGPEFKAASILGNMATPQPSPDAFHDNF